jgi:hypothetical protein
MNTSPENIISLLPNEIFVFGSNYMGKHGKGAAKTAFDNFGAIWGKPRGLQGQSYGIPTKGYDLRKALPLSKINEEVNLFITFAKENPQLIFLVTEIGCGLAGYDPKDIAPFFNWFCPNNIYLPKRFVEFISTY